ncbi:hypothetical protein BC940DRAFT_306973 [Gongronella butleri]|nr:hypothetical protein BC940DRAFT_306973 [Gongronella butleri]
MQTAGTKHEYPQSVSTVSTARRPPAPKMIRRESPSDRIDPIDPIHFGNALSEEYMYYTPVDQVQELQMQLEELKIANQEQQRQLDAYHQQLRFTPSIVKEAATRSIEERLITNTDELTEETISHHLMTAWINPKDSLTLPFAIRLFRDEWKKQAKEKTLNKRPSNQALAKVKTEPLNTKESSPVFKDEGGAIYITASTANSSQQSFLAISTTSGSRVRMIAATVNDPSRRQAVDDETKNGLMHQFLEDGTNASPHTLPSPPDSAPSPQDTPHLDSKLNDAEIVAVKEVTRKCFMSFQGKMIIESQTERLDYLEKHCPVVAPISRVAAAEFFKSELEKVRNKTKKQLLRHQNYSTEKWNKPIQEVCALIVGKPVWDRMTKQEQCLISGKYAFLRIELENIRDRQAKVKWDKLQDEFERYVHGYDGGWEQLCGYWISKDTTRYNQRMAAEQACTTHTPETMPSSSPVPPPSQPLPPTPSHARPASTPAPSSSSSTPLHHQQQDTAIAGHTVPSQHMMNDSPMSTQQQQPHTYNVALAASSSTPTLNMMQHIVPSLSVQQHQMYFNDPAAYLFTSPT